MLPPRMPNRAALFACARTLDIPRSPPPHAG